MSDPATPAQNTADAPSPPPPPNAMSQAIPLAKRALRQRLQSTLSSIPPASLHAQSQRILSALVALPEYASSRTLSVFLSRPAGEPQTLAIVRRALRDGKRVFVPHLERRPGDLKELEGDPYPLPKRIMSMLELRGEDEVERLVPDKWGIPSFTSEMAAEREAAPPESIDLLLLPGCAFDEVGGRLGYGGGFYDYFMWRADEKGGVGKRVALALEEMVLAGEERVPRGGRDWRAEVLVSGDGKVRRFGSSHPLGDLIPGEKREKKE